MGGHLNQSGLRRYKETFAGTSGERISHSFLLDLNKGPHEVRADCHQKGGLAEKEGRPPRRMGL